MADIQRGRTGWKKEEDTLLFAEIEKSVGRGTPLKSVFEAVAEQTGRKPNSVRNYYYARIKEKDLSTTALHAGAFVPLPRRRYIPCSARCSAPRQTEYPSAAAP